MDYELVELTPEEMKNITEDLQNVLKKYDCEMAVKSSIEILKRVEKTKESVIESPYDGSANATEETDSASEESSESTD